MPHCCSGVGNWKSKQGPKWATDIVKYEDSVQMEGNLRGRSGKGRKGKGIMGREKMARKL